MTYIKEIVVVMRSATIRSSPDEIRIHTTAILSRLTLPVGLPGHMVGHQVIETRTASL